MTFRAPHIWLSGVLLATTVLSSATPAEARRQLVPNRPSVELNLDVLKDLRHHAPTVSGLPFARGSSEAVKRQGAPASVAPAPLRRAPPMNSALVAASEASPTVKPIEVTPKPKPAPKVSDVKKNAPKPVPLPPPPLPKPAPAVEPAPTVMAPEKMPIIAPEPIMPLPEPDMEAMTFDDFPELEPLPEVSFDEPNDIPPMPEMEDIPAPESLPPLEMPAPIALPVPVEPIAEPEPAPTPVIAPPAPEDVVEEIPALPAMEPLPEMPPLAPAAPELPGLPSTEGLMNTPPLPSAAGTPDSALPSLDALTGEVSAPDATLPPLPEMEAMPELPAMSDMPAGLPPAPEFDTVPALVEPSAMPIPAPTQMASLPTPDTTMPAIEPPAPIVASDGKGFSIQFAETENESPVSAQSQLAALAESLKGSDKKVIIRPYVDNVEESSVSNVIGARRAFSIRGYLIDKGMERFNITIDRNQESAGGSPERVELVVQ
jgi:hypothetical protein